MQSIRSNLLGGACLGFGIGCWIQIAAAVVAGFFGPMIPFAPGTVAVWVADALGGSGSPAFVSLGRAALIVAVNLAFYGMLGAGLAWRHARHAKARSQGPTCRKCKYSLIGNVSGVCPECGTPIRREHEGS